MSAVLALGMIMAIILLWLSLTTLFLWRAQRRGRLRRTFVWLVAGHALLAVGLVALLIDLRPQVVTPVMTTADKVSLRQSIRRSDDSRFYEMSLGPELVSRGLRTGGDLVHVEIHSQFELQEKNHCRMLASIGLPGRGYLNLAAAGAAGVRQGSPTLDLETLRVGQIRFPAWLSQMMGWALLDVVRVIPLSAKVLDSTELAQIQNGQLELEVQKQTRLTPFLAAQLQSSDARATSRVAWLAVEHWMRQPATSGEAGFIETTRRLFHLTQTIAPDWPASRQNEAAVLAGSIAMGHPKLAVLSGIPIDRGQQGEVGGHGAAARAHGRRDLVQHFWVSAGLAQLANSRLSKAAGLMKEEMDSGPGGSGFSFADLLADKAGIQFERRAVASEDDARSVQAFIAGDWTVEDLIPAIDGLPEGIGLETLEQEFGGVHGERFRELTQEIDARLQSSRILGR